MLLIALGANLLNVHGSPPLNTCLAAVKKLGRLPGLRVAAVSRWYQTAPIPPSGQPPYINGVVALDGEADPAALLQDLQKIEAEAGRVRGETNAARPLDLDILAMGDLVRDAPDPVVPHPRLHQRAFVLLPLRDVVPTWRHPRLGRSVTEMIAALPPQPVAVLDHEDACVASAECLGEGSAEPV